MDQTTAARQGRFEEETEIDLLELARVVWNKIWMVAIGFVVGAILLFVVTKFLVTPQYEATSAIYIFSKSTSITSLADIQVGSSLTPDYKYIATIHDTVDEVIDTLHLDTTYEELINKVKVNNPASSHMLEITVTDDNPVLAANISNTWAVVLREQVADLMNTDRPSIVQRAMVPEKQSSPHVMRSTAIGALVGAIAVIAVLVVQHLLDDTIKSEEDVRKYLQLDTLAQIPYIKTLDGAKKPAESVVSSIARSRIGTKNPASGKRSIAARSKAK